MVSALSGHALDRLGGRNGAARHVYAENRPPLRARVLRSGATPHQIRLRSRLYQSLLLLDQLLPILSVVWFVAVILEVGHFTAQSD
jgi:hypothetical protein